MTRTPRIPGDTRKLSGRYASLVIKKMDLAQLKPHPKNPRRHPEAGSPEWEALKKSIEHDYFDPLVWNKRNGKLVSGHLRKKVLEQCGFNRADVVVVDYDEKTHVARMIAANKLQGEDDLPMLKDAFEFLDDGAFELQLTGWHGKEIENLLIDAPQPTDPEPKTDRAKALCKKWGVKSGQLWKLGEHRLLCGDSTRREDVGRLMDGKRAALSITSPPYNVAANSSLPNRKKYIGASDNKSSVDYLQLLNAFLEQAFEVCGFVWVNVQSVSGNKLALIEFLYQHKERYADTIIWDKQTAEPAMARKVLNSRFEFVHGFSAKANRAVGTKDFRGTIDNVISINSRQGKEGSDVHRATFPQEFASFFISHFCNKGERVYEPFAGIGTALIACENLGRKCHAMEIHPEYVAVSIQRWVDVTKKIPILDA